MNNKRYVKVMFGNKSGANGFEYKIGEVNVTEYWNPNELDAKNMGGFNFSTEDKIIRWLVRGDTIYDVIIPEGSEVIDCPSESTPHGVFRTNRIIIVNPRLVTDEIAMELYKKSNLPEKSYFKAMAGCCVRGYINTAKQIFKDKIIIICLTIFLLFDILLTVSSVNRTREADKGIPPSNGYERFLDNTFNSKYLKNMFNNNWK